MSIRSEGLYFDKFHVINFSKNNLIVLTTFFSVTDRFFPPVPNEVKFQIECNFKVKYQGEKKMELQWAFKTFGKYKK